MEEKKHDATPHRLREAHKRGEVVFSSDVSSTVSFVVVLVSLWLLGGTAFALLHGLWRHATSAAVLARPDDRFAEVLLHTGEVLLWGTIPVTLLVALAAFAGSFMQVGGMAAWSRIQPDMKHLNPAQGFERLVSTRNLINLLKMLFKTLLLGGLMYAVISTYLDSALKLGYTLPATMLSVGAQALLATFGWAAVVYAVMAAVDYTHVRYEFMKQQRMSTDELRREHKEMQGDPLTSSRRRSTHFESVYFTLADRVRLASAVIHSARTAVALQYLGEHDLPRVIARGEGEVAAQIRRLAGEALVPMEFEPALADRLHAEVPVDQAIPRSLYEPVATLLRWAQGQDT